MMVSGTAGGAAASTAGPSSETREERCEKGEAVGEAACQGGPSQPSQAPSSTLVPFCACGMALENFLNLAMKNPSMLCVWG